ncbi:MAG: cardiolipin synthase B [Acidimicrobiia bacterium]|nr:cardiolipin synthase B [Acidimicrobiia bacterium]
MTMTDPAAPDTEDKDSTAERLRVAVESIAGAPFAAGNDVTVLCNGDEIFPSMMEAIGSARTSIDFVTFVYWTGTVARDFAHALAEKARDGVRVRVVLDAFGSQDMDNGLLEELRAAGAIVERFRPIVRWKVWESDHRTHRKILIVDDCVGFTGGVGIASEWEGTAATSDEWRDTHFRIEGPAVLGLKAAFLSDWRDCGHPIGREDIDIGRPPAAGDIGVAVLDASAHIGFNPAERLLEALVAAADEQILIQTPYFNPPDGLIEGLIAARRRGVDVKILLPGPHIDKRISEVVALNRCRKLAADGIQVWQYQPTMMHVKAVMVDGRAAMVGSVNFNRRSVEKDEEVAIGIVDERFTSQLIEDFEADLTRSKLVQPDGEPLWRRLLAVLLYPIRREF